MSLILKVTNADFSGLGLPQLLPMVQGFPAANLAGLYLFEDGTNNQPYASALDSSGTGNNAPVRTSTGWTTPTKKSYGISIPEPTLNGGAIFDSNIPFPKTSLSWVVAVRNTHVYNTSISYPALLGRRADAATDSVASGNINNGPIFNQMIGNAENNCDSGIYMANATANGLNRQAINVTEYAWNIFGITLTNTGRIFIKSHVGTSRDTTGNFAGQLAAITDYFSFGCWRHNNATQGVGADIGLVAVYSAALTDSQLDLAITAAYNKMVSRGETVL